MEAEARKILAATPIGLEQEAALAARRQRIEAVIGIWEDRSEGKSTDEIMHELRGDD